MKKIIFFKLVVVLLLFVACEEDEPTLLTDPELLTKYKWEITRVSAKDTGYDLFIQANFATKYKGTSFQFNNDGTMFWELQDGSSSPGTWYFNQDFTTVTTAINGFDPVEFLLLEMSHERLIVKLFLSEGSVTLTGNPK